ncbi:MAG TPA: RNA-binding protein [Thermoanaerobaculia bacterium]|nr:RNA-binding protein [Thermoanaerobaculia bacterium]
MTRIYVGNLPFSATEPQLEELFGSYGKVESVSLVNDRQTGRPRGFGFVEMPAEDAAAAISALDGSMLDGRTLRVNEAQPRKPGGGGGGGGGHQRDRW